MTTIPSPPYHPDLRAAFDQLTQPTHGWRDLSAIDVRVTEQVAVRFTHRYVVSSDLPGIVSTATADQLFLLPIRKLEGWPRAGGPQDVEVVVSSSIDMRVPTLVRAMDLDETPELRTWVPSRDTSFLLLEVSRDLLRPGLRVDVSHDVPYRRIRTTATAANLARFSPVAVAKRAWAGGRFDRLSPGAQLTIAMKYEDFRDGESPALSFHVPAEMAVSAAHVNFGVQLPRFDPFRLSNELEAVASSFEAILEKTIPGPVRSGFVQLQVRSLIGLPQAPGMLAELHAVVWQRRDDLLDDLQVIAKVTGADLSAGALASTAGLPAATEAALQLARSIVAADPTVDAGDISTWFQDLGAQLRDVASKLVGTVTADVHGEQTAGAIFGLPRLAVLSPMAVTFGYSNAEGREAGRRASFSLVAVGALLLLLLARLALQVGPTHLPKDLGIFALERWRPRWNRHISSELKASQDALVALLVFFPSILFTQVDRIGRRNPIEMQTNYVALRYLFAALVGPLACAGLIVGKAEVTIVLGSLCVVGVLLLWLAALAARRFSPAGIHATVSVTSLAEAERWKSQAMATAKANP